MNLPQILNPAPTPQTVPTQRTLFDAIQSSTVERRRATMQSICDSSPEAFRLASHQLLTDQNPIVIRGGAIEISHDSSEEESNEESDEEQTQVVAIPAPPLQAKSASATKCVASATKSTTSPPTRWESQVVGGVKVDWNGNFWADHDETCRGTIDSDWARGGYPEGFLWDCSVRGRHPHDTCTTHAVALLPGSPGAEAETDPGGPRPALEEQHGEDNAERHAEAGADEHRREAAVPLSRPPRSQPTASRPRLQALRQSTAGLDEQIRQAAHIIGLPDDWLTLHGGARAAALQRLVRARADWVLRWILDKWKDGADGGARARSSVAAWKLADWMIRVLPVSRCAPHLRDAQFLSIIENTLEESLGADIALQPTPTPHDGRPRDVSDSSETVHEEPQPSRKRKRGSNSGTDTPTKRAANEAARLAPLFDAVRAVIRSIRDKASSQGTSEEPVLGEHMQMVLRTESAQAARILKCWLQAVQRLATAPASSAEADYADLSLVVDVWELRAVDAKVDSGASTEQFATECLAPVLSLSQALRQAEHAHRPAIITLDRLLTKHVLLPSRTAFFGGASGPVEGNGQPDRLKAELLSSSLEPLRARLLQAAQIEDSGEAIPACLSSLFSAVPQLLDLVIRFSPAQTPKSRIADKPWIQAAFVSLAECAGCSLEAPEFTTSRLSIDALRKSLHNLASHDMTLDSAILKDVFWFHSGLKYPLRQERVIHWPLIAALIELDPDIFLADPHHTLSAPASDDRPEDLAGFLFDQISATDSWELSTVLSDLTLTRGEACITEPLVKERSPKEAVIQKIIVPIMSAFARNRNLRGFIDRWNHQLNGLSRDSRHPMKELGTSIWKHDGLVAAVVAVFEASMTPVAVTNLLREYGERLNDQSKPSGPATTTAAGNDVIIQVVLQSITSWETVDALEPQLQSLWSAYSFRVLSDERISPTSLAVTWMILCHLLLHLWPRYLHGSPDLQKQLLYPLIDRAASDGTSARKDQTRGRVDSSSRAAALNFLFSACDHLKSLPGTEELIRRKLQKALKVISPGQLERTELVNITEIFCCAHVDLLNVLETDSCQAAVSGLLLAISTFDEELGKPIAKALAEFAFEKGSPSLQTEFTSACLEALSKEDKNLHAAAVNCFLQATPLAISREQREAVLDNILTMLGSQAGNLIALLSIMSHLMEVPNATAKISSDGAALFNLAQQLHDSGVESPPALQLLQILAQSTLTHILPNKDQSQNRRFLDKHQSKIASTMKKSRKCSPARLAIVRGTFLAAIKDDDLLPVDQYSYFLTACLLEADSALTEYILDALNDVPTQILQNHVDVLESVQNSLREWITSSLPSGKPSGLIDAESLDRFPSQLLPAIHKAIAKYQLYSDTKWFLSASSSSARTDLPALVRLSILDSFKEALLSLELGQKLQLITSCISADKKDNATDTYRLFDILVSTMEDKLVADCELKTQQLALLPKLCFLLGESPNDASFNALLDSITTIIREKYSLTTQYGIECVLEVLHKLTSRYSPRLSAQHAPAIFERLCATARSILLLHRGRLGGRFHLLLPLLQNLLLCLFIPNGGRGSAHAPWLDTTSSSPTRLTPANASQFSRLLSTLCSPTQSSVQRPHHSSRSQTSKPKKDLNDPVKAAREYASQYMYPLLSSYCRFQLYGRLEPQVRENLMAGIWEVVGVGCLDRASLDSMFSGLGKSERDVWKETWREWERVHGKKDARWGD
ncbi:hypothetical protein K458DRAFT_489234 [Lentithecium fluviatile CBS 122367]|uniref:Nucleolar 27S pre-rRNA processing Urb2/Npa2 C-terminal domain-containing protein n=1 Tax=Lentithecium fluviatile CBS 122367 TaxID=1168545 RepID=A0A6G1IUL5_9PLEO|nr:hypothetical protein K458DRAFT_489234 [Lentithecium fluviatile CBS 122367]